MHFIANIVDNVGVVIPAAVHFVCSGSAVEDIVAVFSVQPIVASSAGNMVVAVAAIQMIGEDAAFDRSGFMNRIENAGQQQIQRVRHQPVFVQHDIHRQTADPADQIGRQRRR